MSSEFPVQLYSGGLISEPDGGLRSESENDERPRRDLLIARCGSIHFGLFADEADFIIRWKTPTPLPFAPNSIHGIVSVRGRVLTVLNPIEALGMTTETPATNAFIVGLRGGEQLGLAVDRVERILEILLEDIVELGPQKEEGLVQGFIDLAEGRITILDVRGIFESAVRSTE